MYSEENNYIFSILGVFAKHVRDVIPVHYATSLAASPAILAYARVAMGDAMALFMNEDNGRDSKGHSICDAPSWLPRAFAQMSYQEVPTLHISEYDGQIHSVLVSTMMALLLSEHHIIASMV
ncbi:hypothetical protein EPUS_01546 [Endocarpon pusillum Z07020]|uniref:Uncharacterized protein n=1 Tax=Endocarpon pusillum (strain Z07020 / HMAS-L-300199) TaxID=1263415 RepID=U1GUK8_ENDPU|nr:uncharacterized protein EPUS_01546 [Endocarpon pusillum Z07020]ERF75716.1 hypothetical protein EPUS_01546 [Endocarpon pusillum Z07020]